MTDTEALLALNAACNLQQAAEEYVSPTGVGVACEQ